MSMNDMFSALDKQQATQAPAAALEPPKLEQAPAGLESAFDLLDRDKKLRATNNLADAQQIAPDQAARALQVSRETGIPMPAVEENLDEAHKTAQLQQNVNALEDNPKTTAFLADNPLAARLAQDDIPNLTALEKLFNAAIDVGKYAVSAPGAPGGGALSDVTKAVRAIGSGAPSAGAGLYGAAAAPFELLGLDTIGGWLRNQQKSAQGVASNWMGTDKNASGIERAVLSGFQSAGQNLLTLPLGLGPQGPALMLGSMGVITGGQSYGKARDQGVDPFKATAYAIQDATAEVVTEKFLGAEGFLRAMKAGAPAAKLFAYELFKEVPGEISATLWQNFNEWTNLNPDKSVADFVNEQPQAVKDTVIATLVGGTTQIGTVKLLEKAMGPGFREQVKAGKADQAAQVLGQLDQLTQASKLRERDPESFNQFVKQLAEEGPVQDLYISANALMQGAIDLNALATQLPAIAEQVQAVAAGSDLRIPVEDYLTRIAGTDLGAALTPHLKTEIDGLSQTEAQEYLKTQGEQLKADVEKTLADQQQKDEFNASLKAVEDNVLQQLEGAKRFTTQVNQLYASLIGARFGTLARQMGITPQEAFELKPLRIQATGTKGEVLNQEMVPASGQATIETAKALQARDRDRETDRGTTDLDELTESVKESGVKKPITITVSTKDNTAYVTDGNNRLAAAKRAGIKDVPYKLVTTNVEFTDQEKAKAKPLELLGIDLANFTPKAKSAEAKSAEAWLKDFLEGSGNKLFQEKVRGSYSPDTNTITLFKNADLSTFLHETGHFFLDLQAHLAALPNAPQQIHDDMETLLEWFGVKATPELSALDAWHAMSLDEQREAHEKFARGFEAYLFEGKAPNVEIQGAFSRFRAWLVNVYKALKNLNVQLTDEVRGVMDRMLATQEEIEAKQAADSMGMMFKTQEEANKFGVDWAKYHALADDSTAKAVDELTARSLKDMQWFENAKGRELKRLQKDAAEKRAEVKREVRPQILSSQLYRAWAFLTGKQEMVAPGTQTEIEPTASGKLRLNVEGLDIDEATKARLRSLRMTSEENGMHPDIVAELFGYSSGSELIQQIVSTPTPNEAVNMETDRVMLERYGDLTSPEALNTAATEAVHNTLRQKLVAAELKALEKAGAEKTGKVRTLPRAARMFAEGLVNKLKVKDIKPRQYEVAEARAAREAEKAMKAGKTEEAATQKRNQLINGYATRAAIDAQDEVEAARRYFRKFDSDSVRKSVNPEYTDQIDQLLERYEFRAVPEKTLNARKTLADWLQKQEEMGLEPDIPQELLNTTTIKNYRDMTMEELRGLVDTVKQIEHLGRLKNKLLTAQDQKEYATARDEMVKSIRDNAGDRKADTRTPNTWLGEKMLGLKNFWAMHIKAATWARVMDGGKDGGPVWEYLIRPANEAGNKEVLQRAKATEDLTRLMKPVLKQGNMGGKGQFFPSINRSLNREARIAIALNTGNQGNQQRLLDGEGWTQAQIAPVLDTLTKEDWEFVQSVWDYFETFRPEIAAKERRVYGKEPDWVKPTPVQTKYGEYRGGYYPIKYDPRASSKAEEHADAETARQLLKGAYTSATTKRSFTKTRAEEVRGRPLMYSLDGIYSGVNEIIHDLAWHEWLIDANRLLKSTSISTAMRETYGPDAHQQFKNWARDIAVGNPDMRGGEKAIAWLRQGVSISGLGLNVMSALVQPLGITQSIVRVGPKWVGRGIAKAITNPIDTAKEINEKSDFMRTRYLTRMRELAELRNRVKGQTEARRAMDSTAYFLMLRAQQLVDIPTWWGAYEKATAEGNAEKRAIALADQAVIDSQGSGTEKDQAAIERGSAALKLFTVFYSFQNTALNLGVAQTMTSQNKAKLAADYLLLYVAPVILMTALKEALVPGGDDDPEKLAKKFVAEELSFLFGLMFMVREFAGAVQMATGTNAYPADYQGPAGVRFVADVAKLGKQIGQGEMDDGLRKAVVNVGSELLRLPGAQINRTITGAEALQEGDTKNPMALLFGYDKK